MQALARLGIKVDESVSLDILLGENFNGKLYGLTPVQIEKVKALREVLVTYNNMESRDKDVTVTGSPVAVKVLYNRMKDLDHEEAWIAYLSRSNKVIRTEMLFKGSIAEVALDPRTVISKALCYNASAVLLYHNHPSGDPTPSKADITQTAKLKEACGLMDIFLLDHIVISRGKYYSFADEEIQSV